MIFRHPHPQEIASRDALLTAALRPDGAPFPIMSEYPLVLAPHCTEFSHILHEKDAVVAHANLLPRWLVSATSERLLHVGFVGNVATDERWRGRGCMRTLFENLEHIAHAKGLAALILWSDLLSFYQGLGFGSRGGECRVRLGGKSFHGIKQDRENIALLDPSAVDDETLMELMHLRPTLPATVERTPAEMRELLAIPATVTFLLREASQVMAWGILGKGCDMAGVVHEWGFRDGQAFLKCLAYLREACSYEEIMALCPAVARSVWAPLFEDRAVAIDEHPMAIVKPLRKLNGAEDALLDAAFVWGLDSI